jgi:hypothetical protein
MRISAKKALITFALPGLLCLMTAGCNKAEDDTKQTAPPSNSEVKQDTGGPVKAPKGHD